MSFTDEQIRTIIRDTVSKLMVQEGSTATGNGCLFDDVNDAIAAAKKAQAKLMMMSLEERGRIVEAIRAAAIDNAELLAKMAHEETGYGRVEDKIKKNILTAQKTPGIEDLQTEAFSGDDGLTIVESAPYGVIGSITPSTNPTSTVVNNSMSMIAAGNAVVFNPHPAAKKCSQEAMKIVNEAIIAAGGPENLVVCATEPNMESSNIIMSHPDIKMLAVTGGEGIVKVAMKSGKKAVCAGPGNPPVMVDETADIPKAGKDIVDGASLDNNVMCFEEKECFVVASVADQLMDEMQKNGAIRVYGDDIEKIKNTVLMQKDGKCVINRKFVGKCPSYILTAAGVSYVGDPRLVIAEVDKDHPFIHVEMMMPILGICRVADFEECLAEAFRAENGCWHSAMIHSRDITRLSRAAKVMNTTIFVKNGPSYAGLGLSGEGYSTLTIATPTGEGLTSARSFTRKRRCVVKGDFRII